MSFRQTEADFAPLPVPGTILRRNPREERGRRRQAPPRTQVLGDPVPDKVIIEDVERWVAMVATGGDGRLEPTDRDLLATARLLAGNDGGVIAILPAMPAVSETLAGEFAVAGADRVIPVDWSGGREDSADDQAERIHAILSRMSICHILFADDRSSADLARRVAARRREIPASRIRHLTSLSAICAFDGDTRELHIDPPRVIMLAPDFPSPPMRPEMREARVLACPAAPRGIPSAWRIGDVVRPPAPAMPLKDADFIISAGAGVTDWETFRVLADRLDAAIGGSRVVCDRGDLERDRQVGASGTQVNARAYLAFGISGAPQHLEGIQACQHVVSVNTDPKANMATRANLSICADAQAVMAAMLKQVEARND
ncbi:MAG: FAD-binding protein [Proteobacteria bacterium]|jgi:electron transfer flavoprotein alpha subunit|nr:FAD-binding protein [Pseudomonadota bacterium]